MKTEIPFSKPQNPVKEISVSEIEAANKKQGLFFFSDGATGFFQSRYVETAYLTEDGATAFFVTSEKEKGRALPRRFTVRKCDMKSGSISRYSDFQQYETVGQATRAARIAAALHSPTESENKVS